MLRCYSLTEQLASEGKPRWSPDGSWILFESIRDGNPEIYIMEADGSNVSRLTDHPFSDADAVWSTQS